VLNRINLKYFFTPLTSILFVTLAIYKLYLNSDRYTLLIVLGLVFSLVGDIFNMLETGDQKNLQFGLVFFLFTHLIYSYAFYLNYTFNLYHIFIVFIILIILISVFFLFNKNFKTPIVKILGSPYMLAVSLALLLGIGNLTTGVNIRSIMVAVGIGLFWLSDLIVGFDAFYKKIKYDVIYVWGLYASAQVLIVLSCYN
jgi:uncharacterized membrane protein YhhN